MLALEFSPVVLERFKLHRLLKVVKAITIPLVILGVILSTLHQSSLGSLFLIIPGRMHPLWYSNIIPFLFIISCVAAGLAMTIVESFLSSRAFGREVELPLLSELARVIVVVLALYFTVRIQDLMSRDALGYVFTPTYQSAMFLVEILLGVVLPFCLLLFPKIRSSKNGTLLFSRSRPSRICRAQDEYGDHEHGTLARQAVCPFRAGTERHARSRGVRIHGFAFVARYFNVFGESPHTGSQRPRGSTPRSRARPGESSRVHSASFHRRPASCGAPFLMFI